MKDHVLRNEPASYFDATPNNTEIHRGNREVEKKNKTKPNKNYKQNKTKRIVMDNRAS